jgi:hypothetical protein
VAAWAALIGLGLSLAGFALHFSENMQWFRDAHLEKGVAGLSGAILGRFTGLPLILGLICGLVSWVSFALRRQPN